jgi:hypothetical protein
MNIYDIQRYLLRRVGAHSEGHLHDLLLTVDSSEEGFDSLEAYKEELAKRHLAANPLPPDARDAEIAQLKADLAAAQGTPAAQPAAAALAAAEATPAAPAAGAEQAALSNEEQKAVDEAEAQVAEIRAQALARVQSGPQTDPARAAGMRATS